MQKKINTQGELYDELRALLSDIRDTLMLARYPEGIYLETLLEDDCSQYALKLFDFNNRQLVMAFPLMLQGLSIADIHNEIKKG